MNTAHLTEQLKAQHQATAEQKHRNKSDSTSVMAAESITNAIDQASLDAGRDIRSVTVKIQETSPVKSVETPDFIKIVDEIKNTLPVLQELVKGNKLENEQLSKVNQALAKLPTSFPDIPEQKVTKFPASFESPDVVAELNKNRNAATVQTDGMIKALRALELKPADVNVKAPNVDVNVDLNEVVRGLEDLKQSIGPSVPIEMFEALITSQRETTKAVDGKVTPVSRPSPGFNKTLQLIESLSKPGVFGIPTVSPDGSAPHGLRPLADYDHIAVVQTSATVETLIYRLGGDSGTVIMTIITTYTNSSKEDVASVEYS